VTNTDTISSGSVNKTVDIVSKQLRRHEGLKLKPYYCTAGKLTIGYGRNLDDVGITKEEAEYLLQNQIQTCIAELQKKIPDIYNNVNHVRQAVLVNMCYNMGITELLKFKKTLASIQRGDYKLASEQMLQSLWAEQVGNRAKQLSELMKNGY
jgi:lysozyme